MHGHAGCVSLLLELGCFTVDEVDQTGATAMAYACENGHLQVVQLLSSHGARRNHLRDVAGGYFAFEAAAFHHQIVEWLARTKDWCSPLHHASLSRVARATSLLSWRLTSQTPSGSVQVLRITSRTCRRHFPFLRVVSASSSSIQAVVGIHT
mmetsp:Transcript_19676/g.40741  ORF Transcript_19676/g.40741 Transcript_19676/m.40741 type:complete len:152 (-) Transcript_19676:217-672(-)